MTAKKKPMTEWDRLAAEVREWSNEEFEDDQPAVYPLMGAGEELGELVHSHLKRLQGIREDDPTVGPEAEKDAVADVTIYLADYVHRKDIEVPEVHRQRHPNPTNAIQWAYIHYGNAHSFEEMNGVWETKIRTEVAQVLDCMRSFAELRGWNYEWLVADTWYNEVAPRKWDSNVSHSV